MLSLAVVSAVIIAGVAVYFWRQSRQLRHVLKQYAGPKISALAPTDPGIKAGRMIKTTVLFCDMRGFTSLSEALPPEHLALLLQMIFRPALECIRESGAEVDKMIGDAILCRHSNPVAALVLAQALQKTLEKAAKHAAGRIGCICPGFASGLHFGEVFTCHIGSAGGFVDYSILGDVVNTASRIQGLAPVYGFPCLISGDTFKAAEKPRDWRLLDVVRVKGCSMTVELYCRPNLDGWTDFEFARSLYVKGKFDEAANAFIRTDAPPVWAERSTLLALNPPKKWNGIWNFSHK